MVYSGVTVKLSIKSPYGSVVASNYMHELSRTFNIPYKKNMEHLWGPTDYTFSNIPFEDYVSSNRQFNLVLDLLEASDGVTVNSVAYYLAVDGNKDIEIDFDAVKHIRLIAERIADSVDSVTEQCVHSSSDFEELKSEIHDNVYSAVFLLNTVDKKTCSVIQIAMKDLIVD